MEKKICIIGSSGLAKEIYWLLIEAGFENRVECFMEPEQFWKGGNILGLPVKRQAAFNPDVHCAVVGIGDPAIRHRVVYEQLPAETEYATVIHPSVKMSKWNKISRGSIITAGNIITCDVSLGEFCFLNLNCTIGHDTKIGDFFTSNPAVNISGSCNIGNFVFIGTNAAIRQGVTIPDHVTIGMGSVVLKNIKEPGTYIGNPAKFLI